MFSSCKCDIIFSFSFIIFDISWLSYNKIQIKWLKIYLILTTENKILTNEIQLNNLNKEFSNSVLKYDKILSDSVIYPGFIGNLCKFKTFHDFMDYCILNIKDLNTFKNKNNIDLKDYKNQLTSMINFFKSQINNILSNANKFTKEAISNSEIIFIGTDRGLENDLVPRAGYELKKIKKKI